MKKRTDQLWRTFNGRQVFLDAAAERFVFTQRRLGRAVVTQIIPDEFIRVQIRCITGKKVQLQLSFQRLHIRGHEFGFMSRQAIDHQKDRAKTMPHKLFKEFHKPRGGRRKVECPLFFPGEQLTQLMIDFNVGVSTVNTYEVKRIDTDYFEE